MKKPPHIIILVAMLSISALVGCRSESANELGSGGSDARARQIAKQVIEALGGLEKYNAVRYLSFHFVVERDSQRTSDWRHDWDRHTDSYRLAGKNNKGEELLIFFNLRSRLGEAFKNGQPVEGEELTAMLELGYGRFINDTYWLLMPYKLSDPGVMLSFDGEETIDQQRYEVIKLTFAPSVGLTPQNIYRVFVDPSTGRIHRWEYFAEEGKEPRPAWWNDWREFNGLMLAVERKFEGRTTRLLFENIVVSQEVPAGLFSATRGLAMLD